MARHTGRRVQRTHGPMLGLLVGCALWAALGGTAWAKPKPVLILPFQSSTETDAWFGEAIAETLFVASQGTPALLPIDRSRATLASRGTPEGAPPDRSPLGLGRAVKAGILAY